MSAAKIHGLARVYLDNPAGYRATVVYDSGRSGMISMVCIGCLSVATLPKAEFDARLMAWLDGPGPRKIAGKLERLRKQQHHKTTGRVARVVAGLRTLTAWPDRRPS